MRKLRRPMSQSRRRRIQKIVSITIAAFLAVVMVLGSVMMFFM